MQSVGTQLEDCATYIADLLQGERGMVVSELNAAVRLATICSRIAGDILQAYPDTDLRQNLGTGRLTEFRRHCARSFHDANIDE